MSLQIDILIILCLLSAIPIHGKRNRVKATNRDLYDLLNEERDFDPDTAVNDGSNFQYPPVSYCSIADLIRK